MHFRDLPQVVHFMIFKRIKLQFRMTVLTLVCRQWNAIVRGTQRSQHYLFLLTDSFTAPNSLTRAHKNIFCYSIIRLTELNHRVAKRLTMTLPNVRYLIIMQGKQSVPAIQESTYLIRHWSSGLIYLIYSANFALQNKPTTPLSKLISAANPLPRLKVCFGREDNEENPFRALIEAINELPQLRTLTFCCNKSHILDFDLPILSQLERVGLYYQNSSKDTLERFLFSLNQYASSNDRLQEIRLDSAISIDDLLSLPPTLATKFNYISAHRNLDHPLLEAFCDRFYSLTRLSLNISATMTLSQLTGCLVTLQSLKELTLWPLYGWTLPQSRTDLKQHKGLRHFRFYLPKTLSCKTHLRLWQLDWIFPKLKLITVYPNSGAVTSFKCTDCHVQCSANRREQLLQCARHLFRPVAHMCLMKIRFDDLFEKNIPINQLFENE